MVEGGRDGYPSVLTLGVVLTGAGDTHPVIPGLVPGTNHGTDWASGAPVPAKIRFRFTHP